MSDRRPASAVLALTLLCLGAGLAHAQCIQLEDRKFIRPGGGPLDFFGNSVDVDGDVAVVGAYGSQVNGLTNAGAANILRWDGSQWKHEQELLAPVMQDFDAFGIAVAISGDVAIIGASGEDLWGAAHVFRFDGSTWNHEEKLFPTGPGSFDDYGFSVAISGDLAAVGHYSGEQVWTYRYESGVWVDEGKVNATGGNGFGQSISMDGTHLIIGDPLIGAPPPPPGRAQIYQRVGNDWQLTQTLQGNTPADFFGLFVAIDGEHAAVASEDNRVDLYRLAGSRWIREKRLMLPLTPTWAHRPDLDGDLLVIGTPVFTGREESYVYRWTNNRWVELARLQTSRPVTGEHLGMSVAVSGDQVLIGAPQAGNLNRRGRTYVYTVPDVSLQITSPGFAPGDPMKVEACGGGWGLPLMLAIESVSGAPMFLPIRHDVFDSAGAWSWNVAVIPPGLTGITLELRLFGLGNGPVASNPALVLFN